MYLELVVLVSRVGGGAGGVYTVIIYCVHVVGVLSGVLYKLHIKHQEITGKKSRCG